MSRTLLCLAIVLSVSSPPRLAAQTLTQEAAAWPGALRDSLAELSDTAGVRRIASAESRRAAGGNGDAQLRLGVVGLRLGELRMDRWFNAAQAAFRNAARSADSRAAAAYGLGLAYVGAARAERDDPLTIGLRAGRGALVAAQRQMSQALASEPDNDAAALALVDLALELRDSADAAAASAVLRVADGRAHLRSAARELARGRLERQTGAADSAVLAFRRYRAASGDSSRALLELARTSLAAGLPDGESLYYAGAASADSAAAAGYRDDIAPLVDSVTVARFDALRSVERQRWLRRFWHERDEVDLRRPGERLREHYRRMAQARRDFALSVNRRRYGWRDAFHSGSTEFDDRGIIYLRHGDPTDRLRPHILYAMPNETWRYARPDGDLLLHFSGGGGVAGAFDEGGDLLDYRLVESVRDIRGLAEMPLDQLLLSRQSLSPRYSRMLKWGPYGAARMAAEERGWGRASIAEATTTDSHLLSFARALEAMATLVGVGTDSTGSRGQLVFALRDSAAAASSVRPGAPRAVHVRIVALDAGGRPVGSADSTMFFAERPHADSGWLLERVPVVLPPGRWRYRVALDLGNGTGTVLPLDDVMIPAESGRLALSDLAIGLPAFALPWCPTPADTVYLTPFTTFRRGGSLELFYELHGASAGHAYRHEIAVVRRRSDQSEEGRPRVSLSFDEPARAALVRARRALAIDRLPAGAYILRVRVTDPGSAATVESSRPFIVVDR